MPTLRKSTKTKSAPSHKPILISCLLLLALVLFTSWTPSATYSKVTINGRRFWTQTADDQTERALGLSGRPGLRVNQAMLFNFDKADYHCFWMKDMNFNIDILWFNERNTLVYVKENAPPSSYPNDFCPPEASKYVLEIKAGEAQKLNLKIGQTILEK